MPAALQGEWRTDWWQEYFDDAYVQLWEQMQPYDPKLEAAAIEAILTERGVRVGHVLDAPCGTGRVAEPLAAAGYRVHGVDASPHMVRHMQARPSHEGRLTCEQALVQELGYVRRFDAALCWFNSLGYTLDPADDVAMLRALGRSVVRDGCVLIDFDHLEFMRAAEWTHEFSLENEHGRLDTTRAVGDDGIYREHTHYEFDGRSFQRRITFRVYGREEMRDLCTEAGLEVVDMRAPDGVSSASDEARMIAVAVPTTAGRSPSWGS